MALSGEEIARALADAHKRVQAGAFAINVMLTKRRLNLAALEQAAEAVSSANDAMRLLLTQLRGP